MKRNSLIMIKKKFFIQPDVINAQVYLDVILKGAAEHSLPPHYIDKLKVDLLMILLIMLGLRLNYITP